MKKKEISKAKASLTSERNLPKASKKEEKKNERMLIYRCETEDKTTYWFSTEADCRAKEVFLVNPYEEYRLLRYRISPTYKDWQEYVYGYGNFYAETYEQFSELARSIIRNLYHGDGEMFFEVEEVSLKLEEDWKKNMTSEVVKKIKGVAVMREGTVDINDYRIK